MCKSILSLIVILFFFSQRAEAQFEVSIHQSNLPFIGLGYGIGERVLPELRVGTDNYLDDTSLELVVQYIFFKNSAVNTYVGLGGRTQFQEGLVVPLGLHIFPFDNKAFGFHIELTGLLGGGEGGEAILLRGSGGIRYRFIKVD